LRRNKDSEFEYILPVGEYRSQGEAHFADWLYTWRIPFVYEPECLRLSSGVLYRPDFVLPTSQVMVEIKPIIFHHELKKAREAATILPNGWHFWIVEMIGRVPVAEDVYQVFDENGIRRDYDAPPEDVILYEIPDFENRPRYHGDWGMDDSGQEGWMACTKCLRPFIISSYTYCCQHCHAYDGDHFLEYDFDLMHPPRGLKPLERYRRRKELSV
jgi:hypothetical protein